MNLKKFRVLVYLIITVPFVHIGNMFVFSFGLTKEDVIAEYQRLMNK